ncbi:PREDICTED: testis-expressed sequence 2 protein-like [Cyprinodon variegatus]|uniref:testis-expressed sequence 2 protein-like n=1 Tax=Cyprinodon variegatus TaxID=28743 RepID=UPI000742B0C9|nr:PREDICTED: testis-expressed sequence 2 protein-like [Cyprinodon variegatus]
MEESKLFFSLDHLDEGPSVVFSKDKPQTLECQHDVSVRMTLDLNQSPRSQPLYLPHSPSSPGSLSDLTASSADLLISTGLVKSSSTDLKPKESSTLRGKPLLSLVKSFSTEISRRGEPENNLSKSDSKLHLHPWKQVTHPKIPEYGPVAGTLSKTEDFVCPLSTCSISPSEPRGSSLIAELEDTRRKFSEAMQDPLSMLSRIMGDESSGSPKHGRGFGTGESPAFQGSSERDGSSDDPDLRCRKRTDNENRAVCDAPLKKLQKDILMQSSVFPKQNAQNGDKHLEICTYGDVIQVEEPQNRSTGKLPKTYPTSPASFTGSSMPFYWLIPVSLLAYGFFVLPLSPYLTGLSMGIACGFILGLLVVFWFSPGHTRSKHGAQRRSKTMKVDPSDEKRMDTEIIESWMNEAHSYDPDTFHPSMMHSVYVTLDGKQLHLAHPHANIPRWAAFDEPNHEVMFSITRTYQLANSKVSLVPPGLARKRIWNKKYPICITLAEGELGEESLPEGQKEDETVENSTIPSQQSPATLYLFGRTGREKEEWFQHLLSASKAAAQNQPDAEENAEAQSGGEAVKEDTEEMPDSSLKTRTLLDYSSYMMQLIDSDRSSPTTVSADKGSPSAGKKSSAEDHVSGGEAGSDCRGVTESGGCSTDGQPAWINSLVGRIFWDFLREKYWTDQVAHKIQKKLSKIKLPYFMNELTLADLDMGSCLPQVLSTSKPTLDRRGLWLDLELVYTGCLQMTLETKMNLGKLGKEGEEEAHISENLQMGSKPKLCILVDSDEESSSAASSDEEETPLSDPQSSLVDKNAPVGADGHAGGRKGRKILRFVDKITKSKYFQKATENEYIKKKIAEVSNMPLILSVEVLELSGSLTINIPPPPTDRIWYSFRVPPRLDLYVRPMLGEREVTFTHVTEWIEKKLQCEFQKIFVMPNMDDLYLPLMTSGLENPPASHRSSVISSSHQSSMESQEYVSE